MGDVMEDHVLEHVVKAANADERIRNAQEFAEIVKAYLKYEGLRIVAQQPRNASTLAEKAGAQDAGVLGFRDRIGAS
jgi:hypothetical protein